MIANLRIAYLRRLPALALPLALAACVSAGPIADPEVAILAERLNSDAASFYAALAITPAPQCLYEQNKYTYDSLRNTAGALQVRLTAASAALARAGTALARLVEQARTSHQAASARADDLHDPCMAPGAIALNAQAIARASAAISAAYSSGDQ